MGLTADIGRFVAGLRYNDIPADATPIVCRGFTDCVGVTLAGLPEPVSAIVAKSVNYPSPVATIADFGDAPIAAPDLALIYGSAAHALDYDDTGLNGHPSAVLVPAILAEAQETGADGKAMIAAYVAGYEIWAEFVARDRRRREFGTITLAFARAPSAPGGLILQGWNMVDAQNNRTAVRLAGQRFNQPVDDNAFSWRDPRRDRRRR